MAFNIRLKTSQAPGSTETCSGWGQPVFESFLKADNHIVPVKKVRDKRQATKQVLAAGPGESLWFLNPAVLIHVLVFCGWSSSWYSLAFNFEEPTPALGLEGSEESWGLLEADKASIPLKMTLESSSSSSACHSHPHTCRKKPTCGVQ